MSIKDALASAGGTEAAFLKDDPIGTTVQGVIISAAVRDVTKFGGAPGEIERWDDGNPKQQVRVVIQTEDYSRGPDDNGERAVFIKWWGDSRKALIEAIRAAGDDDLHEGGHFAVRFQATKPSQTRGYADAKIYAYRYVKPEAGAGLDFGGEQVNTATGEIAPAQQAQEGWGAPAAPAQGGWPASTAPAAAAAQQAAPVQPAAPAPEAATGAALVLQLHGLGLDTAAIQSTTGQSPEAIAAIIQQAGA